MAARLAAFALRSILETVVDVLNAIARPPATLRPARVMSGDSRRPRDADARRPEIDARGHCAGCNLPGGCLPSGLSPLERRLVESAITSRNPLRTGEVLFGAGDRLQSLCAVRAGFFKTSILSEDGREQVTGFYMPGDMLGIDGIYTGRHTGRTVALDQSEVCVISYANLMHAAEESPLVQRYAYRMLGREIVRNHGLMLMLGTMCAEERLVTFLLSFSRRMQARGYSPSDFLLRMTREELGSFLGLRLETVSRSLSKLHAQGLIDAERRHIRIRDMDGLSRLTGRGPPWHGGAGGAAPDRPACGRVSGTGH